MFGLWAEDEATVCALQKRVSRFFATAFLDDISPIEIQFFSSTILQISSEQFLGFPLQLLILL